MITIASISKAVAHEYGVPEDYLKEPSSVADRKGCMKNPREVSHPRQVAMTLAYLLTENSQTVIGSKFGGRDHTTVFHARHQVEKRRKSEAGMNERLRRLTFEVIQTTGVI